MSKRGYLPEESSKTEKVQLVRTQRRPHKRWHTVLAVLISALLGALLAWGWVSYTKGPDTTPSSAPTPTPSETVATPSANPSTIAKPRQSATSTPEEAADSSLDKSNIRVWVLNASSRHGWAKETAEKLQRAGFVNPIADNSTAEGLETSTVIYRTKEFEEAAKEAAKVAGIDAVVNAENGNYLIGDTDIAVYLIG